MMLLYMAIGIVIGVGGYAVAKTTYLCSNKVQQLTAPKEEKIQSNYKKMKGALRKAEENHRFLNSRFSLEFGAPGNGGNKEIENTLLAARKDLVCANFKLSAYTKHTDSSFCKELASDFYNHLNKARAILQDVSSIWAD